MSGTLQNTIPSYLYQEYSDDDDLQAFVDSYNTITQEYINTFNNLNLPIYVNLSGSLLDWVGQGVYGYPRPTLPASAATSVGPLNTYGPNFAVPLNTEKTTAATSYVTSDDIYKRLLTWHFYKGDGKVFSINWLKKRIVRFLNGANGAPLDVDDISSVSIKFVSAYTVQITLPNVPAAPYLQSTIASGAAELPFQFSYTVVISSVVYGFVPWRNNSAQNVSWNNNLSQIVPWRNY